MVRIRLAVFTFFFTCFGTAFCFTGIARAHPLPDSTLAVSIQIPEANVALQGKVSVVGSTAVDGMLSWVLEFGYTGDTTDTWFVIAEGEQAITAATLAEWDTTTLTDGNYTLRLTVQQGETTSEDLVPVRVRNYTPIETPTAQPVEQTAVTALVTEPVVTLASPSAATTLTPLPTNPAELTSQDVASGIKTGALLVVIIFLLTAAYLYLRHLSHL